MLVDDILTEAGYVASKTYRETRFAQLPKEPSFCLYTLRQTIEGDDYNPRYRHCTASIELFEYPQDGDARKRIEHALNANYGAMTEGWSGSERVWDDTLKTFVTSYDFDFIDKEIE